MQIDGVLHRADHIVTAMHDDAGNVTDFVGIAQQLVIDLEKALVHEVMVFDACEAEGEMRIFECINGRRLGNQGAGGAFPDRPGLGRR